jgi:hypothetical protein
VCGPLLCRRSDDLWVGDSAPEPSQNLTAMNPMAENKPKIDLKSRLGKKTVAAPAVGGSIPPPVGIPRPMGVAPSSPSGIPAPPFASTPQKSVPRVDATDPYAALPHQAAPVMAQAAAIRIELGDEVREAQRRGRSKVMILAAATAVIGGVLGFTFGGSVEKGKGTEAALRGAEELVKEIESANAEITKLADTLKGAREKLGKGEYPEEAVSALGSINIPFKGANLTGKNIGRFKAETVSLLIDYVGGTEEANDQKEKLQNILAGNKAGIQEFLAQQKKPKVRWQGTVVNGPSGPWFSLGNMPKPFTADDKAEKWPDEFEVKEGNQTIKVKRYNSGSPMSSDPLFIPVDPTSMSQVCPSDTLFKLRREVVDMETVLRGDNSTPGEEKMGLLERGQKLVEQLKRIGKEPG